MAGHWNKKNRYLIKSGIIFIMNAQSKKIGKQINLKFFGMGASKPKGPNRIGKIKINLNKSHTTCIIEELTSVCTIQTLSFLISDTTWNISIMSLSKISCSSLSKAINVPDLPTPAL